MTILLFPGNSKRNKQLIQEAKSKYEDVIALEWNHWNGKEDKQDDINTKKINDSHHPKRTRPARKLSRSTTIFHQRHMH